MIQFITKRFNVIVLMWMLALFSYYIIGYSWLDWYEPSAKSVYYSTQSAGLIILCAELYYRFVNGWFDGYQFGFNIIGFATIALNSIIFALNFQGVITNAAILLLVLWICETVITIGVLYNLKKYEHI